MKNKIDMILKKVLPNKNLNIFIFIIIILGITFGTIFFLYTTPDDKKNISDSIITWKQDLNNINFGQVLVNALFSNFLYLFLIYIFGISLIGIIINVFLVFLKGFVVGFNISTFISIFGLKGILFSFEYVIFSQFLLLLAVSLMGIYSINFSYEVIRSLFKKKLFDFKHYFKKYNIIFLISISLIFITSLFEAFIFPTLLKLTS